MILYLTKFMWHILSICTVFCSIIGIPVIANSDDIPVHSTPIKVGVYNQSTNQVVHEETHT